MKRKLFIALCIATIIVACNKEKSEVNPSNDSASQYGSASRTGATSSGGEFTPHFTDRTIGRGTISSQFIPSDTANEMINSYIYSVSSGSHASDLHAFSIDADLLRTYLANTSIKNVKLILAHTMDYIHSGFRGVYAGMQPGAVTIIIAGYDNDGNYVYKDGSFVLDHASPCPYTCPPGAAGDDLLH